MASCENGEGLRSSIRARSHRPDSRRFPSHQNGGLGCRPQLPLLAAMCPLPPARCWRAVTPAHVRESSETSVGVSLRTQIATVRKVHRPVCRRQLWETGFLLVWGQRTRVAELPFSRRACTPTAFHGLSFVTNDGSTCARKLSANPRLILAESPTGRKATAA